MKNTILLLFLLTSVQLTHAHFLSSHIRYGSPFSCFGSWPYYSFDSYDHPFYPKAYDDYYS